jgi:hypothetical protein
MKQLTTRLINAWLKWRYRAAVSDLRWTKDRALPCLGEMRREVERRAGELRRRGVDMPVITAEAIRRDIERQLKEGVLL